MTETTVAFPSRELHDTFFFFAILGERGQNGRKLLKARKKYLNKFKFGKNIRGWTQRGGRESPITHEGWRESSITHEGRRVDTNPN